MNIHTFYYIYGKPSAEKLIIFSPALATVPDQELSVYKLLFYETGAFTITVPLVPDL